MSAVPSSFTATSLDRRIQMLRTAMGPLIAAALDWHPGMPFSRLAETLELIAYVIARAGK